MRHHAIWLCGALVLGACEGHHQGPGQISGQRVPAAVVAARDERQVAALDRLVGAAPPAARKQILFGDLHVHTTYSVDAYTRSLPFMQGEGLHPPADACDFARFCADLDFWSINDHAEAITPAHWQETKESIRQCNAVSGDPAQPDVVAFLGWEWTQVGRTAPEHYGHKNVIFRETAEDRVPARPITPNPDLLGSIAQPLPLWQRLRFPLSDWKNRQRYFDFAKFQEEMRAMRRCPEGVDTRQLPADCQEVAQTPQVLFEKLSQWGFDTIVIPHGTTWGFYTPPDASWDKQLTAAQHDPVKQTLFEVYSGHGNSEEYRGWRPFTTDASGEPVCPEPTREYLPCCWQAGELIRARCGDAAPEECERRVAEARRNYVKAGLSGHLTVPGAKMEEWKDCAQCRDCYNPAFNYRPANSAQYVLALANFDQPDPLRFRFGFIASSDNHSARPGTGYKEYKRRMMTEATGPADDRWRDVILPPERSRTAEPVAFDPNNIDEDVQVFQLLELERQASFFMTGGLVAVHADGRSRDAIWSSLTRREVYGTSGERILLWFDLLNAPDGERPMGSEVALDVAPRFRVRAVGSFKQRPGCPEHSTKALAPGRLESLCRGECYHPSDERYLMTRIDIIRVRPQQQRGEPVGALIEDPWQRLRCAPDPAGCAVEFEDPDFVAGGRDVIYYARAVQEPTPAVNAGGLRCRYDGEGRCVEARPCYGDFRTPFDDDCLTLNEERAWSSPIYVNVKRNS